MLSILVMIKVEKFVEDIIPTIPVPPTEKIFKEWP